LAEFLDAALNYSFMRNAIIVAVLVSVACGVVGSYVVARRITYIAGSISHAALGGIGIAHYMMVVYALAVSPLAGAVAAAVVSAIIIGLVSLKAREREDTVIGAIWAVGMAVGILFISRTPGYSQDLMSYLFGNILMVSSNDVWLVAILDLVVIALSIAFHSRFQAVCYDEEFARVRGLSVEFYYLLLLCMTALTVVVLVTVVGIVMVIALISLPAAIAGLFTRTLRQMIVAAAAISMVLVLAGLAISYSPSLPAGATIILVIGVVYLVTSTAVATLRRSTT
jgi:zinc transport system permease protein